MLASSFNISKKYLFGYKNVIATYKTTLLIIELIILYKFESESRFHYQFWFADLSIHKKLSYVTLIIYVFNYE